MKIIKNIILAALLLTLALPLRAQVFITEGDYENPRDGVETQWGYIPEQWVTNDQANDYAPLGEGLMLLTALGGAYLTGKRKQQQNKNKTTK